MNEVSNTIAPGPYVVVQHGNTRGLITGEVVEVLEVTAASVKFQRADGKKFAVSRAVAERCLRNTVTIDPAPEASDQPEPFRKGNFSNDLMRKFAKIE